MGDSIGKPASKQDRRVLKGGMGACAASGAVVCGLMGLLQLGLAGLGIGVVLGAACCAAASRAPRPGFFGGLIGVGAGVFFGGWWAGPLGGGLVMQLILAASGGSLLSWLCGFFSVTRDRIDERQPQNRSHGAESGAEVSEDGSEWFRE
jgi:hypothetical protein